MKDNFDFEKLESLPKHQRMFPPDEWREYKELDRHEHHKIDRWIESQVGRNWNDVYSDFCAKFNYKTESHADLLRWRVNRHTFMHKGNVMTHDYHNVPVKVEDWREYKSNTIYVHPETNILCKIKHKKIDYDKKRKEELAKTLRVIGPWHQFQKHNGIWYEIQLFGMTDELYQSKKTSYSKRHILPGPKDKLNFDNPIEFKFKLDYKIPLDNKYYFRLSYTKKQLNKKELTANGLKNSP